MFGSMIRNTNRRPLVTLPIIVIDRPIFVTTTRWKLCCTHILEHSANQQDWSHIDRTMVRMMMERGVKFEWVNYCYSGDRAKFEKGPLPFQTPPPPPPPPFWRSMTSLQTQGWNFPRVGNKNRNFKCWNYILNWTPEICFVNINIFWESTYTARTLNSDKKFSHEDLQIRTQYNVGT